MTKSPLHVAEVKQIPEEQHYAVLLDEPFSCDDGYGGRDHGVQTKYIAFSNIEQLQAWILQRDDSLSRELYRVIQVSPCTVSREVRIGINQPKKSIDEVLAARRQGRADVDK